MKTFLPHNKNTLTRNQMLSETKLRGKT